MIKSCVKSFTFYKNSMCNICVSFVPTCDPGAPGDPGWPSSPFSPSLPGGPSRPGGPLWPRSPYQTTWIITAIDSDCFFINLSVKMYDIFTRYLQTKKKTKHLNQKSNLQKPHYKSQVYNVNTLTLSTTQQSHSSHWRHRLNNNALSMWLWTAINLTEDRWKTCLYILSVND